MLHVPMAGVQIAVRVTDPVFLQPGKDTACMAERAHPLAALAAAIAALRGGALTALNPVCTAADPWRVA